jgi:predicted GNAT family acetyltransferase
MFTTNSPTLALKQLFAPALSHQMTTHGSMAIETLTDEHESEILSFLATRPLHTVIMAGYIRDNGVVSPFNRGTFYGYRGSEGSLDGVALIGHATLLETRTAAALLAFAKVAQNSPEMHLIMAEPEKLNLFWSGYAQNVQRPRGVERDLLLQQRWPVGVDQHVTGLRRATMDDIDEVMLVQAEMALAEGGVNPMEKDPMGFRRRCARRIGLGRTWVLWDEQKLIFKVDIMAETPEATYLEGVWVNPQERGKRYGLRCLSQVGRNLLRRTGSICVLVNENNPTAHAFYRRAGFKQRGSYEVVYLESHLKASTA